MLEYFKNLWKRFIEFLQNKFFSTDKYDNIIQDLYNEDILDNDDIDIIQNNKSKNEEIGPESTKKLYATSRSSRLRFLGRWRPAH